MKRIFLSWFLLISMIIAFVLHLIWLDKKTAVIIDTITSAQKAVRSGSKKQSYAYLSKAHEIYKGSEIFFSITINEKQLDEVRMDFARAEESALTDDTAQYQTELAGLKESVTDLKRSELITFGNIL